MHNSDLLKKRDVIAAFAVILIWGANFVPMKIALIEISPFELGLFRYLFAAIPLCFFFGLPKVRFRWIIATAIVQCIGQFSLLFIALNVGMTAALASVLFQTQIYFTALWGFFFFRTIPSKVFLTSMICASIGMLFFGMSAMSQDDGSTITFLGIFFMLCASSMWGCNNIIVRQVQHESPDYKAFNYIIWSSAFATIGYVVIVALFVPQSSKWLTLSGWSSLSVNTWCSILFVSWASTLVGYSLWTRLLQRYPANQIAPFSLAVPVIGLFAGIIVLNETVDTWQWTGTFFIGIALILVVFGTQWIFRIITKKTR